MTMLRDLLEAMDKIVKIVDELLSVDDFGGDTSEDDDANPPPVVSPAKKAERSWPTRAHRTDTAPAWPPFSGHRVPLGGGR